VVDAAGRSPLFKGGALRQDSAMASDHVWDELPERDPLVQDLLEVESPPAAEEAALHIIHPLDTDLDHEMDDVLDGLAVEDEPR